MKIPNPRDSRLVRFIALTLAVLLLPVIAVILAAYLIAGLALQFAIWLLWCARGNDILLVYSDSPNWKEYVESRLLSPLEGRAVIVNWSERRKWKRFSLASVDFTYFGGGREFNPLVVLFRPLHWARTFRFYKPLRKFKNGHPEDLERLERALYAEADRARAGKG